MKKIVIAVLSIVIGGFLVGGFLFLGNNSIFGAEEESFTVEISTKLGVKTVVTPSKYYNQRFGDSYAETFFMENTSYLEHFLLEMTEGAYIAVPWEALEEITVKDGISTVTVSTGQTVTGKLLGKMWDNEKDTVYDLTQITSMRVVKRPKKEKSFETPKPEQAYSLQSTKPEYTIGEVTNPRFAFLYSESYKAGGIFYTIHTKMSSWESVSFVLTVNGENILTNLTDFATVSIVGGNKPTITVISESGIKTTGAVILKTPDEIHAIGWALLAKLPLYGNSSLFLVEPTCTFKIGIDKTR